MASEFNVTLTGEANEIADRWQAAGWTVTTRASDSEAHARAQQAAQEGQLVLAGLQAEGGGLVAVVVARKPADPAADYPYGYWGRQDFPELAGRCQPLNHAWSSVDRNRIVYACRAVA